MQVASSSLLSKPFVLRRRTDRQQRPRHHATKRAPPPQRRLTTKQKQAQAAKEFVRVLPEGSREHAPPLDSDPSSLADVEAGCRAAGLDALGRAVTNIVNTLEPAMTDNPAVLSKLQRVIRVLEEAGQQAVQAMAPPSQFASIEEDRGEYGGAHLGEKIAQLWLSGSYRAGVGSVCDDIDAVLLVPGVDAALVAEHLEGSLTKRYGATKARRIRGALLEILDVEIRGIPVDLTIASVPRKQLPLRNDTDLLNDQWLRDCNRTTVIALNGPRCTERYLQMIMDRGGRTGLLYFQTVLRFLRCLCRARGVYGNKYGYLGGINCAILATAGCLRWGSRVPWIETATRICERFGRWTINSRNLFECAQRPVLVRSDFTTPVAPWNPAANLGDRKHVCPILSPCFPVTNTWTSASAASLAEV